jgi:hypothetical protein
LITVGCAPFTVTHESPHDVLRILVIRDVEVRDAIQSLGRREVARKYESVPFVAVSRHADDESASSNVVFNWYDGA